MTAGASYLPKNVYSRSRDHQPYIPRDALTKLRGREGGAGAERAILPYVSHVLLISTSKIGADYCQLCQYKLIKPNLT